MPATTAPGRWLDRHIAVLVVALVTGVAVMMLLVVGRLRMEAWQRGLLTTGRRTTGTVLRHERSGGRNTTSSITLAVAADPSFDVTMDVGSFDRYAIGRTVDVWYDPADAERALRTSRSRPVRTCACCGRPEEAPSSADPTAPEIRPAGGTGRREPGQVPRSVRPL